MWAVTAVGGSRHLWQKTLGKECGGGEETNAGGGAFRPDSVDSVYGIAAPFVSATIISQCFTVLCSLSNRFGKSASHRFAGTECTTGSPSKHDIIRRISEQGVRVKGQNVSSSHRAR
jgi:hypothetical protein